MSEYQNEAGEWLMDGAAIRFEQQLDAEYAEQRYLDDDDFFGPYEDEGEECPECGDFGMDPQSGECSFCGYVMGDEEEPIEDDDLFIMEDQWLDSYMEDRMTTMFE